ncbi:MAG TPA: right-handed parallel beta-helix repeat-containing protein, partial [Myxococcaceae bacterium]|nr:right-handed parallel beta-helix repeat-containing protein [Myxococcaceae bacterium]
MFSETSRSLSRALLAALLVAGCSAPSEAPPTPSTGMEEDGPLGPSSVDTEEHQPFGSTATHRDIQCGSTQCTLTISAGGYRSLDGTATSVSPGSRICLATGQMTGLVLKNLHGTAAQPIEVVNCNGEVLIAPTATVTSNGFVVEGSSHLKITGTGHTGSTYGIKISQTKSQGLYLTSLSTNIEVDHLEISQTGFAGIMAKTDPKCDGYGTRGTFTMRGIHIHDNKIHHTRGEGLYIGSTNYNSGISCTGGQKYPHDLIGVRIYRNHIHDTDSDGFQVGCAIQDVEVYDNLVEDYALKPFDLYQDNGIQIGDGTTGKWFNNVIRRGPGNAFIVKGLGNISVFNNLAEDTAGIYVHNAIPANAEVALLNNTFIKTKARGIEVAEPDAPVKVHNNIMVPLAGVTPLKKSAKTVESHNLFNQDINYFAFVNAAAGDYHLTAGSPARNAGLNVSTYLTFDWEYEARNDGAYDIGADEYVASGNTVFSQDFQSSTTVGAYVNATSPGVGQFNDISAEATGGSWSINGGRLQLVRTGSSATDNDAGVTRWTDFAGPPTVLHVSFDVGVS